MSDDNQKLWTLPTVDVDDSISQQITRRARVDLVRGPSRARFVLPIVAGTIVAGYLIWTIVKLIELLG
jgi:hypothetical protein